MFFLQTGSVTEPNRMCDHDRNVMFSDVEAYEFLLEVLSLDINLHSDCVKTCFSRRLPSLVTKGHFSPFGLLLLNISEKFC